MFKGRSVTLWLLLGAGILTIALHWIPFGNIVLYPLVLFSTYAHEMGHALTALACGCTVSGVSMWTNGAGVAAYTPTENYTYRALIIAGGLLGPSIVAVLMLFIGMNTRLAQGFLLLFGVFALCTAVLMMDNTFGRVFALCVGAISLIIVLKTSAAVVQFTLLFIALQLSLSVFSRSDYLFTEYVTNGTTRMPSDVSALSQTIGGGPYWLWGTLVGLASVLFLLLGFAPHFLIRKPESKQPAPSEIQQEHVSA